MFCMKITKFYQKVEQYVDVLDNFNMLLNMLPAGNANDSITSFWPNVKALVTLKSSPIGQNIAKSGHTRYEIPGQVV